MKNTSTGVVFMILTIFLFSIMNATAKGFATYYPIIEIVWVRYLSQTVFTTLILAEIINIILPNKTVLILAKLKILFLFNLLVTSSIQLREFDLKLNIFLSPLVYLK